MEARAGERDGNVAGVSSALTGYLRFTTAERGPYGIDNQFGWGEVVLADDPHRAERFTSRAFGDFLGRTPNSTELSTWSRVVNNYIGRRHLTVTLANSDEWIGALVDDFYLDTLGRPADPGGKLHWTTLIRNGTLTPAQVAAAFYASEEYFDLSQRSVAVWIRDLYVEILGREPDAGGAAYWANRTALVGRWPVALDFYQSPESRSRRVRQLYEHLLDRAPDPGGLAYWMNVILYTGNDVVLAVDLASSEEYWRTS